MLAGIPTVLFCHGEESLEDGSDGMFVTQVGALLCVFSGNTVELNQLWLNVVEVPLLIVMVTSSVAVTTLPNGVVDSGAPLSMVEEDPALNADVMVITIPETDDTTHPVG